jgi:EpsI family protein
MLPPPDFFHFNLSFRLKLISSQLGVLMMQIYGLSAYREGNVIDLGFTQLQVVDACSGLRYLYPLIIIGILLAYFYKSASWKKGILVLSAIPLTIITNSLRIAMTGILYEIWGPAVAEDFFHGFSGWLIFIFGLAVLLLEMWILNKIFPEAKFSSARSSKLEVQSESEVAPDLEQAVAKDDAAHGFQTGPSAYTLKSETLNLKPAAATGIRSLLHPPQFIVAVVLLAATLIAAQGIEFREKIPLAKSFAEFPTLVGEWTGKRDVMEEKFVKELDLSDYVIVDYQNGGKGVNFYTAYYESQRKGESIHSPETCLPGGGWEFKNAGAVTLPLKTGNGEPMRVNRAFMEKGAYKQLSYFWFPQRDRVLTNAWEMKWYNFWDALTRQRTDGALVRLITPVYPNEDVPQAEARLTAFTREIVPVLNEFLPK